LTIVLSVFFWPLCCLFSFNHCVVCFLLTIVLSVFFWPLCCLFSCDLRLLVSLWYLQSANCTGSLFLYWR
jgi:hypothetical protein